MGGKIRGSAYHWTAEDDAVVISRTTVPVVATLVAMTVGAAVAANWTYEYWLHFFRPQYGPWPIQGFLMPLAAGVGFGALAWEVAHWQLRVRIQRRSIETRSVARRRVIQAEGPLHFSIRARTVGGGHIRLRRVELMAEADGMEPVAVIALRDGMEAYLRPLEQRLTFLYSSDGHSTSSPRASRELQPGPD